LVPLVSTHISRDKKEALSYIHTHIVDLAVYTDGSGYEGQVGMVATIWPHIDTTGGQHLQLQLGWLTTHTIFEAELVGILLAIHIIHHAAQHLGSHVRTTLVALDNQAAIATLTNDTCQSGQLILDEINTQLLCYTP